jgi:hypothetical protein
MPAAASNTYTNQALVPVFDHGMKAEQQRIKCDINQTLVKGTLMGQVTATGLWKPYASGNADGTQNPKFLLTYDVTTDASGNHTIGGGQQGETYFDAPAFNAGDFNAADLTGLDATALTNGKWIQLWGSITTGVIRLPG